MSAFELVHQVKAMRQAAMRAGAKLPLRCTIPNNQVRGLAKWLVDGKPKSGEPYRQVDLFVADIHAGGVYLYGMRVEVGERVEVLP